MNKMNKQIYLHIGVHKTATTAIQVGLARNEQRLNEQGYHLPVQGRALAGINHHHIQWEIEGDPRSRPEKGTLAGLVDEIRQHPAQKFILSSEGFSNFEAEQIRALCAPLQKIANLTVVVYLRRQDELIQSMWAQAVKLGTYYPFFVDAPLAILLDRPEFGDYAALLERWEAACGVDGMRVRLFDEVIRQQDDILVDFLRACDVPDVSQITPANVVNTAPSLKTLEVIRAVAQRMTPDYTQAGAMGKRFMWVNARQYTRPWDDKKVSLLDERLSRRIMAHFAERNAEVARKYFNRDVLFEGTFKPRPVDTFDMASITPDDLLHIAARLGDAYVEQVTHWQGEYYLQYAERVRLERENRALQAQIQRQQQALDAIQNTRAWRIIERYWRLRDRILGR